MTGKKTGCRRSKAELKHTLEKHIASLNKLFCKVSRNDNYCMHA